MIDSILGVRSQEETQKIFFRLLEPEVPEDLFLRLMSYSWDQQQQYGWGDQSSFSYDMGSPDFGQEQQFQSFDFFNENAINPFSFRRGTVGSVVLVGLIRSVFVPRNVLQWTLERGVSTGLFATIFF
ncbi:uncharacterized protein LOC122260881 isoform X2 [Penaeus japonicus]|nr:uncharacterized protein LOC122260881 isoform X2 [Penaeus japonicus]